MSRRSPKRVTLALLRLVEQEPLLWLRGHRHRYNYSEWSLCWNRVLTGLMDEFSVDELKEAKVESVRGIKLKWKTLRDVYNRDKRSKSKKFIFRHVMGFMERRDDVFSGPDVDQTFETPGQNYFENDHSYSVMDDHDVKEDWDEETGPVDASSLESSTTRNGCDNEEGGESAESSLSQLRTVDALNNLIAEPLSSSADIRDPFLGLLNFYLRQLSESSRRDIETQLLVFVNERLKSERERISNLNAEDQ